MDGHDRTMRLALEELLAIEQIEEARDVARVGAGEGSQAAVARLLDELRRLNTDLQVPSPRAYGIDRTRYDGRCGALLREGRRSARDRQRSAHGGATRCARAVLPAAW